MMEEHFDTKVCPRCFEEVNAHAQICRYCLSRIGDAKAGSIVKVRVQAGENTYRGDLFVGKAERMTDVINDTRRFIILTKAKEEGKLRDLSIDFLALNKDSIDSVRESDEGTGTTALP